VFAPYRVRRPAARGDNRAMALRLFRTTGYSTLLMPGEARLAMHPVWLVVATSLWLGLACNVALWRLVLGPERDLRTAAASVLLIAGGAGAVLSLLGWRRTLKFSATVLLLAGALAACGLWVQGLPLETLWQQRPRALLPGWASFMRWQVPTLMFLLALVPIVSLWNVQVRRLPGPAQLQVNVTGAVLGAVAFLLGFLLQQDLVHA
jgi:lipid A ethanolaminephosphotransferase